MVTGQVFLLNIHAMLPEALLLGIGLWGILSYIAAGKDGQMNLKFGIMAVDEWGEFYVHTETTQIPLHPIERCPEFRFGYTLRFADNRTFSSYFVLSLPSAPIVIQGSLRHAERSTDNRVLTSIPVLCQGETIETLAFNDSDPPGRWNIDVYVNEERVRRIRFFVVHP
jgi:hypothetical protein